jgi:signal transduction histidine kinase
MKLRTQLAVTALVVGIPIAVLFYFTHEWLRTRDVRLMLARVVTSQMTDDVRERCESNPNWFLAGPRPDRPTPQQLAAPDADVTAPRAPTQELPFEYFAYDDGYQPLSTAGPRFPTELKQALRSGAKTAVSSFAGRGGTGLQEAVLTGWSGSPCMVILFRSGAIPNEGIEHMTVFVSLAILLVGIAFVAGAPTVARVRRMAAEARQSAADEYRSTVTITGHDEMSAIAFAFNEATTDIQRRSTDIKDRDDSLRRYIASTAENIAAPLMALERKLAAIQGSTAAESEAALRNAALDAHQLVTRMQNLAIAAELRMSSTSSAKDPIDLDALVKRSASGHEPFARASGVRITVTTDASPIRTSGAATLLEQAVNNLIDNAIRYNRPGGQVAVSLERTRDGRFSLRVADDGPGAPEQVLAKLNANRRFRGDEARTQRPGELGLGLAIVREVGDRLGIQWAFRTNAKGWFEAELTGVITGAA